MRRTGAGALLDLFGDQYSRGESWSIYRRDVCSSCFSDFRTGDRQPEDTWTLWRLRIATLVIYAALGVMVVALFVYAPIEIAWPELFVTGRFALGVILVPVGVGLGVAAWWYQTEGGRYLNRRRDPERPVKKRSKRKR